ncbi:MAG: hypothetical protein EXS25_02630 [Pedosphaera sp.]|nr:hypothetical protein [Pedosphaera sp.]
MQVIPLIGTGQRFTRPSKPIDNSVLITRLTAMGFWPQEAQPETQTALAMADVFPWWMTTPLDRNQNENTYGHLGKLLIESHLGFLSESQNDSTSFDSICCGFPIGSPNKFGEILLKNVQLKTRVKDCANDDEMAATLVALAHLEVSLEGDFNWFSKAAQVLASAGDNLIATQRAIARLSVVHGFHNLCPTIGKSLALNDTQLSLECCDALLRLGDAGIFEIESALAKSSNSNKDVLSTALESLESGSLDGLDPYLNHSDWRIRASAVRFVSDLLARGTTSAAVVQEVFIARIKIEDDCDTRWVLSDGLSQALSINPEAGINRSLSLIRELAGEGCAPEVLDALAFGAGPHLDARTLEHVRDLLGPDSDRTRRALNRCLTWVEGVIPQTVDWICPQVIKLLQWGRPTLPPSVEPWFNGSLKMENHLLTVTLYSENLPAPVSCWAIQHLSKSPEMATVWEQVSVSACNRGDDEIWALFTGALAASRVPTRIHPVELRCAVGLKGPICTPPSWAGIGRLLAIASSPLSCSKTAIYLLSGLGPDVRELARHALSTVPLGSRPKNSITVLPPRDGVGPRRTNASPLELPLLRPDRPELFEPALQPLFGMRPSGWNFSNQQLEGLIVACQHDVAWGNDLFPWSNRVCLIPLLESSTPHRIQQAVIACTMSSVVELREIGEVIAATAN